METNVKERLGFSDLPLSFRGLKIEPRRATRREGPPRERGCRHIPTDGSRRETGLSRFLVSLYFIFLGFIPQIWMDFTFPGLHDDTAEN